MQVGKKVSTIKQRTSSQKMMKKSGSPKSEVRGKMSEIRRRRQGRQFDFQQLLTSDFRPHAPSSSPSLSVQASVLYSFGQVFSFDFFAGRKISNCS